MKRFSIFLATLALCGMLTSRDFRPGSREAGHFTETLSGKEWIVEVDAYTGMISVMLPYEANGCTIYAELEEGRVQMHLLHPQVSSYGGRNGQRRTIATLYMAAPASGQILVRFTPAV